MEKRTRNILTVIAVALIVSAVIYGVYMAKKRWKFTSGNKEKDERKIRIVRNPNF